MKADEVWWRIAFFIPIEQQLKAPGCVCQDAVVWPPVKHQRDWLLLSDDLRPRLGCFFRRVSETIDVWYPISGAAGPFTFCGGRRLPSCCCDAKQKQDNMSELPGCSTSWSHFNKPIEDKQPLISEIIILLTKDFSQRNANWHTKAQPEFSLHFTAAGISCYCLYVLNHQTLMIILNKVSRLSPRCETEAVK